MERKMLIITESDNAGVVLEDVQRGDICIFQDVRVEAAEDIPFPHKIALRDFSPEEIVVKYGEGIGHATAPIARGSLVHAHNMGCRRGTNEEGEI